MLFSFLSQTIRNIRIKLKWFSHRFNENNNSILLPAWHSHSQHRLYSNLCAKKSVRWANVCQFRVSADSCDWENFSISHQMSTIKCRRGDLKIEYYILIWNWMNESIISLHYTNTRFSTLLCMQKLKWMGQNQNWRNFRVSIFSDSSIVPCRTHNWKRFELSSALRAFLQAFCLTREIRNTSSSTFSKISPWKSRNYPPLLPFGLASKAALVRLFGFCFHSHRFSS